MAASINDKITDVRNNARPNSTTVTVARAAAGTNLSCNSLTGWPTASKVHFVTYQTDTNNNVVAGTQLDCYGIVSENTITNMVVVDGTDGGNSVGDVVEMLPTAAWAQDLADGLMTTLKRDGTLQDDIVDTANIASGAVGATELDTDAVTTAKINDSAVTTAKIANSGVTSSKLSLDSVEAAKASNFFTSTSIAFQDSGLKITLANPGTWLVLGDIRCSTEANGRYGAFRLYNQTTSTAVTNSERLSGYTTAGGSIQVTHSLSKLVTTTTSDNIIRVELKPFGAWSIGLLSDPTAPSYITAIRVGV